MNNRNRKNPTVIAWEQLRMLLVRFTERMGAFDSMVERQGRDIGIDEVYNEIQNIRSQLDQIQNGLNLYQNKINNERMVDKSQPEIPLTINNQAQNTENNNEINENRTMAKKQVIRLNENQLRRIVSESMNRVLNELDWKTYVNAAKKAGEKGDSRKEKFLNHANNTIKQQYPNRSNKYHTELEHNIYDFVDGEENFEPFLDIDNAKMKYGDKSKAYNRLHHKTTGEEFAYSPGTTYTHGTKLFDKDGTKYNGRGITRNTDLSTNHAGSKRPYRSAFHFEEPTNDSYNSSDFPWDWDKMSKDMEDYYTGKSHYVKGKGWVKDSNN